MKTLKHSLCKLIVVNSRASGEMALLSLKFCVLNTWCSELVYASVEEIVAYGYIKPLGNCFTGV